MQTRHRCWLGALIVLASARGGEGGDATGSANTCEDALARLQSCIDEHCAGSTTKTCASFRTAPSGSLFGTSTDPCQQMDAASIEHLMGASCGELLEEAGLVLDGKADGECPPYFPWCSETEAQPTGYSVDVVSFGEHAITVEVVVHDVGYTNARRSTSFRSMRRDGSWRRASHRCLRWG